MNYPRNLFKDLSRQEVFNQDVLPFPPGNTASQKIVRQVKTVHLHKRWSVGGVEGLKGSSEMPENYNELLATQTEAVSEDHYIR